MLNLPIEGTSFCEINLKLLYFLSLSLDALALRVLHVTLLFMSEFERLRDILAWTLSFWTEDMFFYTYVMAL